MSGTYSRSGDKLIAVVVLAVLLFASSAQVQAQSASDGEALFKAKCVMCHGADAAGKTVMGTKLNVPDLRSPEVQKMSLADVTEVIAKGKNKMPAQEAKLTKEEISKLAEYIKKLKK